MWIRSARPVPAQARTPLLSLEQVVNFEHSHAHATPWEREVIARRGLRTVPVAVVPHTQEAFAGAALARLLDVDHRLIHSDVDVIDFTGAPLSENTGRNEGLTLDQAMAALRVFTAHPAFAARTITELNPLHGAAEGATLERFLAGLVHALRTDGARDCGPPSRRTNFNVLTETIRPYRESARKVADFADAAAPGRP